MRVKELQRISFEIEQAEAERCRILESEKARYWGMEVRNSDEVDGDLGKAKRVGGNRLFVVGRPSDCGGGFVVPGRRRGRRKGLLRRRMKRRKNSKARQGERTNTKQNQSRARTRTKRNTQSAQISNSLSNPNQAQRSSQQKDSSDGPSHLLDELITSLKQSATLSTRKKRIKIGNRCYVKIDRKRYRMGDSYAYFTDAGKPVRFSTSDGNNINNASSQSPDVDLADGGPAYFKASLALNPSLLINPIANPLEARTINPVREGITRGRRSRSAIERHLRYYPGSRREKKNDDDDLNDDSRDRAGSETTGKNQKSGRERIGTNKSSTGANNTRSRSAAERGGLSSAVARGSIGGGKIVMSGDGNSTTLSGGNTKSVSDSKNAKTFSSPRRQNNSNLNASNDAGREKSVSPGRVSQMTIARRGSADQGNPTNSTTTTATVAKSLTVPSNNANKEDGVSDNKKKIRPFSEYVKKYEEICSYLDEKYEGGECQADELDHCDLNDSGADALSHQIHHGNRCTYDLDLSDLRTAIGNQTMAVQRKTGEGLGLGCFLKRKLAKRLRKGVLLGTANGGKKDENSGASKEDAANSQSQAASESIGEPEEAATTKDKNAESSTTTSGNRISSGINTSLHLPTLLSSLASRQPTSVGPSAIGDFDMADSEFSRLEDRLGELHNLQDQLVAVAAAEDEETGNYGSGNFGGTGNPLTSSNPLNPFHPPELTADFARTINTFLTPESTNVAATISALNETVYSVNSQLPIQYSFNSDLGSRRLMTKRMADKRQSMQGGIVFR
jgi:hypothetical protein